MFITDYSSRVQTTGYAGSVGTLGTRDDTLEPKGELKLLIHTTLNASCSPSKPLKEKKPAEGKAPSFLNSA